MCNSSKDYKKFNIGTPIGITNLYEKSEGNYKNLELSHIILDTDLISFAEFAARREQFHGALKYLVVNSYLIVLLTKDGFMYHDSNIGESVCDSMTTEYADAYMDYSYKAHDYMQSKTITELFSYINKMAMLRKEEAQ